MGGEEPQHPLLLKTRFYVFLFVRHSPPPLLITQGESKKTIIGNGRPFQALSGNMGGEEPQAHLAPQNTSFTRF